MGTQGFIFAERLSFNQRHVLFMTSLYSGDSLENLNLFVKIKSQTDPHSKYCVCDGLMMTVMEMMVVMVLVLVKIMMMAMLKMMMMVM